MKRDPQSGLVMMTDEEFENSCGIKDSLFHKIARLQAVVDAARERCQEIIAEGSKAPVVQAKWATAQEILRALDGEVKP
jgi:hypothetical protein